MCECFKWNIIFLFLLVRSIKPISSLRKPSFSTDISSEKDIADLITAKGYLPIESELPKSSYIKGADIDATFLLSKLSDTELIKLLSQQPLKNEYDLHDIVKIALDSDSTLANKLASDIDHLKALSKGSKPTSSSIAGNRFTEKSRINAGTDNINNQAAFFRLENKKVDPYSAKNQGDLKYVALQKLNNILYSRPLEHIAEDGNADEDEKKELLFDVLVAQLKTLCCKSSKNADKKAPQYKAVLDFNGEDGLKKLLINGQPSSHITAVTRETTEHMFLIVNDEIKNNGSEDLISVDPDSLDGNSSVLLLGPITSPLTDGQLKLVMNRLTKELSKPEYVPLLQQLSNGSLSDKNFRLMESLITGPATRRYIKPHRCNHQSRLAKVYGGPKWIICTYAMNKTKNNRDSKRNGTADDQIIRCGWLSQDPLYIAYHDNEWGKPEFENIRLFETLCLEGQQAGLSWITILKKRETYRQLFLNFDPYELTEFTADDVKRLLTNSGIVRHKGKIEAIINNSKCYVDMTKNNEDFSSFLWSFVNNEPIVNNWSDNKNVPSESEISLELSKALKKKGFKFVGSKICYAFMQACGLVNDHIVNCISREN